MKAVAIYCDEDKVRNAGPGENLRVRLSGIEEDDILSGFVLCSVGKFLQSSDGVSIFYCYFILCVQGLILVV